jgi:hypothetical protein
VVAGEVVGEEAGNLNAANSHLGSHRRAQEVEKGVELILNYPYQ